MNSYLKALLVVISAFLPSLCRAQDPAEVQIRPYGSYSSKGVDTVDIETGNVYLNIPLVSFPQVGKLPALSFGISLNNAPYTQVAVCDPDYEGDCTVYYDTLRYGASQVKPTGAPRMAVDGSTMGVGAFLTSSQAGLLVLGNLGYVNGGPPNPPIGIDYSLVDATGGTHDLLTDVGNNQGYGVYRASDGSGFTFFPDGPGDPTDYRDPMNFGLGDLGNDSPAGAYWINEYLESGIRTGMVYDSAGLKYTSTFVSKPGLQSITGSEHSSPVKALQTTISDPSDNQITHTEWGMTRFSGLFAPATADLVSKYFSDPGYRSSYLDSTGRSIQDPIELEEMILARNQLAGSVPPPSSACPNLGISSQPAVMSFDWAVPGANQGTTTFTFCFTHLSAEMNYATLPGNPGSGCTGYTPGYAYCYGPGWKPTDPPTEVRSYSVAGYALQAVVLNDRSSFWGFVYDVATGDLQTLINPTGGTVSYTYANFIFPAAKCGLYCHSAISRTENDALGHTATTTYTYTMTPWVSASTAPSYTTTESHYLTDLQGQPPGASSPHSDTVHTFRTVASYLTHYDSGGDLTYWAPQFKETQTEYYPGASSAGNSLKTVTTAYEYQWEVPAVTWTPGFGAVTNAINIAPNLITTSGPNGIQSIVQRKYIVDTDGGLFIGGRFMCKAGSNGNPDDCEPSNAVMPDGSLVYGATATISTLHPTYEAISDTTGLLKETSTWFQFEASYPYYLKNMLDLPAAVGTPGDWQNYYFYDTVNGVVGPIKGDLTSMQGTTSTYIQYLNGVPQMITDGRGTQTFMSSHQCSGLYPQTVIGAYQSTTTTPETTTTTYDCNTGSVSDVVDPNGITTHSTYADPLGRVTDIGAGMNTSLESHLSVTYPSLTAANIKQDETTSHDGLIQSSSVYDGFGRPIQQTNAAGNVVVTTYNTLGLVASVTNPHSLTTPSGTDGTVYYFYDPFGRPVKQVQQDGAVLWWCYDGVQDLQNPQPNCSSRMNSSGVGTSWVDTTDEAGIHHQQVSNALGQLLAVMDPDPISASLALETDYTYDALGNLTKVIQNGKAGVEVARTRSFTYDSKSHLIQSYNPETGYICYGRTPNNAPPNGSNCTPSYDGNGNLTAKTDARGVVETMTYDDFNRLLTKTSSDGTVNDVFHYDAPVTLSDGSSFLCSQGLGRLCLAEHPGVYGTAFNYDTLGRTASTLFRSQVSGQGYAAGISAQYDLASHLTNITYPDGRVVTNSWDAAGRLANVGSAGTAGGPAMSYLTGPGPTLPNSPVAGSIVYGPSGAEQNSILGSVASAHSYNNRLQANSISAQMPASAGGMTLYNRQYYFTTAASSGCGDSTANGGNIYSIVNALSAVTESFSYDCLHRLSYAARSDGGYNQNYNIDSFGNMQLVDNLIGNNPSIQFTTGNRMVMNQSLYGGTTYGQLDYDAAGNLQLIRGGGPGASDRTFQYDADGHMMSVDAGQTAVYGYDGLGERGYKQVTGNWTEYVYFNGQPVAERTQDGTWTDYIRGNGGVVARVPHVEKVLTISGFNYGTGDYNWYPVLGNGGLGNYPVGNGDKLVLRQREHGSAIGGVGFDTFGGTGATLLGFDQDGQDPAFDHTGAEIWHQRIFDLSPQAGTTLGQLYVGAPQESGPGAWSVDFADMMLYSASTNSWIPIQTEGHSVSLGYWSGSFNGGYTTNGTWTIGSVASTPGISEHYLLGDHLGTARMELASGGWPVWQGEFAPFGGELNPQATANHYKFTGQERDAETGLDNFGARHYISTLGRFTSPDPSGIAYSNPVNPQSLNLYSYVLNNPLKFVDPTGLYCAWEDGTSDDDPSDGGATKDQCIDQGGHWTDDSNPCHGADGCVSTFDWNLPQLQEVAFISFNDVSPASSGLVGQDGTLDVRALMLRYLRSCEGHSPGGYGAYNDSMGFCTAGYGQLLHRSPCTPEDYATHQGETQAQAEAQLEKDYDQANRFVQNHAPANATQGQINAFVDQEFNMGTGTPGGTHGMVNHDAWRDFTSGNNNAVPADINSLTAGGPGIRTRRANEVNMFSNGTYPASCY